MRRTLLLHAGLTLLASTNFTIVTFLFAKEPLQWCYFQFTSKSGFGYDYISEYSTFATLTYLVAFTVGVLGFWMALRQGHRLVGATGLLLSFIGLASFLIEGSHRVFEHNHSLLAFSPAIQLFLVVLAMFPRPVSSLDVANQQG